MQKQFSKTACEHISINLLSIDYELFASTSLYGSKINVKNTAELFQHFHLQVFA